MTKSKTEEIEIKPDAGRLMEGLKETGYTLNTSIADLIDNSIAAKAKKVDILFEMNYRGLINMYMADNGSGMSAEGLKNGMRYGSNKRPDPSSLGKFGLGMKTASTAFCDRLVVVTRDRKKNAHQAEWDVDLVRERNEWIVRFGKPEAELLKQLEKTAGTKSGTLVYWDKVDLLMKDYTNPGGQHQKNALKKILKSLSEHVGMVFQRFLDRNFDNVPNVAITCNGEKIEPWDPFCTGINGTDALAEKEVDVDLGNGQSSSFFIKAWALPSKDEMTDEEKPKAKIENLRQGFYIYRQDRLITAATTLGMWRKEPHSSLFRVQFDFQHTLDEAFTLDLKKSRISLNSDLFDWIDHHFRPAPHRAAQQRYRGANRQRIVREATSAHAASNVNIGNKVEEVGSPELRIDRKSGVTEVENAQGKFKLKLKIGNSRGPEDLYVQVEKSLEDGMFWEPASTKGEPSVALNANHEYYRKVYVPNHNERVTMQGLDSLLWALSIAELKSVDKNSRENFEELRNEVSRILRKLVADLPEPEE